MTDQAVLDAEEIRALVFSADLPRGSRARSAMRRSVLDAQFSNPDEVRNGRRAGRLLLQWESPSDPHQMPVSRLKDLIRATRGDSALLDALVLFAGRVRAECSAEDRARARGEASEDERVGFKGEAGVGE